MFLLDTNVVSELRKSGDRRIDPRVARWASSLNAVDFYISVITLQELEAGILRMEHRDPSQGAKLRSWMQRHILEEFAHRTLPVDTAVALRCASLHVPDPRPALDAIIAATALVHGMTVVTRNVKDFELTGVPIVNPWLA